MSYTVLAVKWRPRRFEDLVGQQHVVRALVNSLAAERLHHAYLFTGTRGVGKTTVARILAKALNCDQGVVAEPCGVCDACTAIDQGRFVDLIEVDAASRTKVDDTRELLDNVQYAPTRGRYKVYLIDEVHMLSNHSFNALLKTLEEPPPHVKFLLATTDPQKLPVTVLSRCLQFNLKRLTPAQIQAQLDKVCSAENVPAEPDALRALAKAADGSLRDALSMLDQGIAFGGGEVRAEAIVSMLGTIDRGHVFRLLEALASEDAQALFDEVEQLAERAPDFGALLDELMGTLQQIAVVQLVGDRVPDEDLAALKPLAERMTPEDVQLYYQIALQGRRDLPVCRDPRVGLEMTLLRMLAFRPTGSDDASSVPAASGSAGGPRAAGASASAASGARGAERGAEPGGSGSAAASGASGRPSRAAAVKARLAEAQAAPRAPSPIAGAPDARRSRSRDGEDTPGAPAAAPAAAPAPVSRSRTKAREPQAAPASDAAGRDAGGKAGGKAGGEAGEPSDPAEPWPEDWNAPPELDVRDAAPAGPDFAYAFEAEAAESASAPSGDWDGSWPALVTAAEVRGGARQLADHCELLKRTGSRLELVLSEDRSALLTPQIQARLEAAVSQQLGRRVTLTVTLGKPPRPTPAQVRLANENERMRKAREAIELDPNVKAAQEAFGAVLEADTIRPRHEG